VAEKGLKKTEVIEMA